ncbi:MAG: hypothetical protein V4487_02750 [Chlamydiota bacterium]
MSIIQPIPFSARSIQPAAPLPTPQMGPTLQTAFQNTPRNGNSPLRLLACKLKIWIASISTFIMKIFEAVKRALGIASQKQVEQTQEANEALKIQMRALEERAQLLAREKEEAVFLKNQALEEKKFVQQQAEAHLVLVRDPLLLQNEQRLQQIHEIRVEKNLLEQKLDRIQQLERLARQENEVIVRQREHLQSQIHRFVEEKSEREVQFNRLEQEKNNAEIRTSQFSKQILEMALESGKNDQIAEEREKEYDLQLLEVQEIKQKLERRTNDLYILVDEMMRTNQLLAVSRDEAVEENEEGRLQEKEHINNLKWAYGKLKEIHAVSSDMEQGRSPSSDGSEIPSESEEETITFNSSEPPE